MTLSSRFRRFLKAIAGKDTIPDPESPVEVLLGDIAKRINSIAEGSGGGSAPYIVDVIDDGERYLANKTWQEIYDAYVSGVQVLLHWPDDGSGDYVYSKDVYYTVTSVSERPLDHAYYINFAFGNGLESMTANNSPNDYPSVSFG